MNKDDKKNFEAQAHLEGELTEQQLEDIVAGWGCRKKKKHKCNQPNRTVG